MRDVYYWDKKLKSLSDSNLITNFDIRGLPILTICKLSPQYLQNVTKVDAIQLSGKFFDNLRSHMDKRLHARRGLQTISFTEYRNGVLNAKSLFTLFTHKRNVKVYRFFSLLKNWACPVFLYLPALKTPWDDWIWLVDLNFVSNHGFRVVSFRQILNQPIKL